jgi:hypothetical protein
MRIDWTKIGAEYTATDEQKRVLLAAVAAIDAGSTKPGEWDRWLEIPKPPGKLTLAMMPGEGIKHSIRELHLPKVTHVSISCSIAPMALYGMRAHYKGNLTVECFVLDHGDGITPLFCRVFESGEVTPGEVAAQKSSNLLTAVANYKGADENCKRASYAVQNAQ